MTGVEILTIVSILMQVVATVVALYLIPQTKYRAMWVLCVIALVTLTVERGLQLLVYDGMRVPNLAFAWMGIIVSVTFSMSLLFARLLVNHVDRMALHRRLLENRLMTAVLRTEERSRASFSRELHDGLGPLLSSAKMSLSALSNVELNDRDRKTLQNTTAVIDEAIRSLREISNNLSPHILNNFGLARGIKHFVDRVASMHDVAIQFNTTLRDQRFDANIEVILYRVVCELINNSLKHSGCSRILFSLELHSDMLHLDYSDNGCGFLQSEVQDRGMGLSNINSRISSLGGSFTLDSSRGHGMSAHAEVSIDSSMAHLSGSDYQRLNIKPYDKK